MTYPTIMPAITLDFQNSQQLDPRVTFSRTQVTGQATYINSAGQVAYAAEHEPRFDHDGNGECLGLLIEESRTNLYETSSDFGPWAKSATYWSLTANSTTAPDGTNTATKCIPNAGINQESIYNITALTDGVTYSGSIFFKAGELTKVRLRSATQSNSTSVLVDLTAGTATPTNCTSTIQSLADGWYRVTMTWTQSGTASAGKSGFGVESSSGETFNGTNGFYAWGAQLEVGSFPSSYIPTSGSTVIRSEDIAQITGDNFSSWYNQSEGTLLTSITPYDVTNNDYAYSFSDGTSSQRIVSLIGQTYSHYIVEGGIIQAQINYSGYTANTRTNAAATYALNSAVYATDGVIRGTDTSVIPPNVDRLVLMANRTSGNHVSGHISRLAYYNERLTDAELQTLTL